MVVTSPDIDTLREKGWIGATDWAFADAVRRLGPCGDPWVALAAALVSRAAAAGHVCLDLEMLHAQGLQGEEGEDLGIAALDPRQWRRRLNACPAVGAPGAYRPLILDGPRLYLHRYATYERNLAHEIRRRCAADAADFDNRLLTAALGELFPEGATDQQAAARLAAGRRFSVISGGPGTGKTHTVAKIILLLQRLAAGRPLKILLAAPTGKAAARMQEAVAALLKKERRGQGTDESALPQAQTLHRLLGYNPTDARFRYNADQPLAADAVIVDEASMIDLALMHQLVQAVPPEARLVLVGDKDQLASVEAGAVLGDICHGASAQVSPEVPERSADDAEGQSLKRHIAILAHSYRFDADSGIGALSRAINTGDAGQVLALLADQRMPAVSLRPLSDWARIDTALEADIAQAWSRLSQHPAPGEAFECLTRFKILTAVRKGPFGVEALNARVERILRRREWIAAKTAEAGWYPGRPVMITRNDYNHGLFNGDVGIAMEGAGALPGPMRVIFPGPQGSFKAMAPHQLPEHETVYAMTIHKSQGSEFEHIMVVLPDTDLPLLTRELIYTAVTRARAAIQIWADPALLARAVQRPIQRASGLRDRLWP
jgi:exodeoxyribonuclease V alpha subunit